MVAEVFVFLTAVAVFAGVLLIIGYYGFRSNKPDSNKVSVKY